MSLGLAVGVVAVFAVAIERLDLPDRAREVTRRSGECLAVLRDPATTDDAKETALRGHAVRLFGLFGWLAGGSALALGLPLAGVWMLDRAGLASWPGVLAVLQRLDFLAGTAVVGLLGFLVVRRLRRTGEGARG